MKHVVVHRPDEDVKGDENDEVETKLIDDTSRDNISRTTIFYANQMLRTIAVCYRDLSSWPPEGAELSEQNEVCFHFRHVI